MATQVLVEALTQIDELRAQIDDLKVQIDELRTQIDDLKVQIDELRVQIVNLMMQIDDLKPLDQRFSGLGDIKPYVWSDTGRCGAIALSCISVQVQQ
ncbi:MAG: hypothetical protein ACFE0I_12645 [Elainellaceae cyanobacterium]